MASPELPGNPPHQLATLPDEILEEIFLRVPAAADLARASASCPNFHRVIADHSFLRRFRALYPPPLLCILSLMDGFVPARPPHPSAAAARTVAAVGAADFWRSFLPPHRRWVPRDFHDGRALLSAAPEGDLGLGYHPRSSSSVRELAVCDPVHRRYRLLPPIPGDLTAFTHQPDILRIEPFLAPAVEDEGGTAFRVMCLVESKTKLVIFIYSSCSGQWQCATFDGWISLLTGHRPGPLWSSELFSRYQAHGCFYWTMDYREKLLVLDVHSMEFSVVDCRHTALTDDSGILGRAIMEAGEGRLGMLTLCLQKIPVHNISPAGSNFDCFSLNLKTFELEWFCGAKHGFTIMQLYAAFPPSLSAPTI